MLYMLCWLKEIGALKQLMQLDVSENKLERLPDSIGQLDRLSDLHLSDNQIDYLPDSFGLLQCHYLRLIVQIFSENSVFRKSFK